MTAKTFGIGLSRTGTTSLCNLVAQLGYRSGSFFKDLMLDQNSNVVDEWEFLGDSPIPMLYKKLDVRYPGSKFILTTRDKEAWLDSMKWMFTHGKVIWNWEMYIHDYHERFYGTSVFNRKILSMHFDSFHQEVNGYFKDRPDDLLVLNVSEKIDVAAICQFLDKRLIEVTFPKKNVRRKPTLIDRLRSSLLRPKK